MTSAELAERLIEFAARVGKVVDALPDTRMGRHIGGQLVRSGTSPAPNYEEACAAESRADFVHKLSISLKELCESSCWIQAKRQEGLTICNLQFALFNSQCLFLNYPISTG